VFLVGLDGELVIQTVGARDAIAFEPAASDDDAVPTTVIKETIPTKAA